MSRGDTYWAWQEREDSGAWGIIAAAILGDLGDARPIPLFFRDRDVAWRYEKVARAHSRASGHRVRFAQLTITSTQEVT